VKLRRRGSGTHGLAIGAHGFAICALEVAVGALGLLVNAVPASAQRAPVLQQIKVRHPYYYREMFIPQVTSGAGGAAWSPDGTELIYSMQGSLWRQRVGSGEARQLTDGPGYDYQPDWSPDGRRIVYAS
jgi:TolB protein